MKPGRTMAFILSILLFMAVLAGAAEPRQHVEIRYDPEARQLIGSLDVTAEFTGSTAYFALLPNLEMEANPYLSARITDTAHPYGVDPAGIEIWSCHLLRGEEETHLAFRLLSMPPAWQTFSLSSTVLAIDLPDPGTPVTLRIAFSTRVPRVSEGDNGLTQGILTWRFGWHPILLGDSHLLEERDGIVFYQGIDTFPYLFPRSRLSASVTLPEGYHVLGGASIDSEGENPDNVSDLSTRTKDPDHLERAVTTATLSFEEPARSIGLTIAETGVYTDFVLDGEIPIHVAYLVGHEQEARLLATLARDILAEYAQRFGPYPRPRLTIVENANLHGTAFAAEGIVWLSTRFFTHRNILLPGIGDRILEYVLAHELAHQWFGLHAEVDLDADAWLSEGLSQYAAVSEFEGKYGASEGNLFVPHGRGILEDLVARQFGFYNLREHQIELPYLMNVWAGFDEALAKPLAETDYTNAQTVRLYDKGYLVARTLASAIGERAFDQGLAQALEVADGGRLTIDIVRLALESSSGQQLGNLFDTWIYSSGSADYAVSMISREETPAGFETTVEVSRTGGTDQPVEVEALLISDATLRQTWDGKAETATLIFRTPSPVARVTIDPDHRLLDRDRVNNHDPVKIVGSSNEAVLPLDAYVLSPDSGSGGFTFSRLGRFRIRMNASGVAATVIDEAQNQYSAALLMNQGQLTGRVAYTTTSYAQPETGSSGTTWEPDWQMTLSGRRIATDSGPVTALGLSAIDLPSVTSSRSSALSVVWTTSGAGTLTLASFDEVRLFPGGYLQATATAGFGFGPLPDLLRHKFDELRSIDPGASIHKLSGRVTIELPSLDPEPFNLLNLAMLDQQRTRLFIAGGAGWTTLGDLSTTSHGLEAGLEQMLDLSTLGGLLAFSARVGVAAPVVGVGEPVLYVQISL